MAGLTRQEVAERAGADDAYVERLIAAGVLAPDTADRLTTDDVRRVGIMRALEEAGLPFDGLTEGLKQGVLSLAFVSSPEYSRFKDISAETFEKNTILKRPMLTDAAGKTYNTAVSFVDVASVPEFSCAIPFRVPTGTALKSIQIDAASLELPK